MNMFHLLTHHLYTAQRETGAVIATCVPTHVGTTAARFVTL